MMLLILFLTVLWNVSFLTLIFRCLLHDAACSEYIQTLSDVEHVVRLKSSARLAVKGVVAKIRVIATTVA